MRVALFLLWTACTAPDPAGDGGSPDGGGTDGGSPDGGSPDGGGTDGGGGDVGGGDGGATSPAAWPWGGRLTPDDSDASLLGELAQDYSGRCVGRVGDLDGDGLEELAVGSFRYGRDEDGSGGVYLVRGRTSGWSRDEPLSDHLLILSDGPEYELCDTMDHGDLSGDGWADLFLAEGTNSVDDVTGAWVFSAADLPAEGTIDLSVAATTLIPTEHALSRPQWFAGPVDFTGDGIRDLVGTEIGTIESATHVLAGPLPAGDVALGVASVAILRRGNADVIVDGAGDLDGDGADDLVAAQDSQRQSDTDTVLIHFGGTAVDGSWVDDAGTVLSMPNGDLDVRVLEDLDGDGRDELLVMRWGDETGTHGGYLYWGRESWPDALTLDDADLHYGADRDGNLPVMWTPADLDGDGRKDLFVESFDNQEGELLRGVVFGRADRFEGGFDPLRFDLELQVDLQAPAQVRAPTHGDLDGDGTPELFLSDFNAEVDGVAEAGRLVVFRGRSAWPASLADTDADLVIEGSAELDLVDAEALLDLNGDGYDDLVFGTLARPEATLQGQVHVFFGQPFDG